MVSEEHITAFGWAAPQEIDDIMALAIRINDFLSGLFLGVGIQLVDFKIECGRLYEGEMMRIVLADEFSPDSARLWDAQTSEKMDKDRFARYGRPDRGLSGSRAPSGIMNENEPTRPAGPVLVSNTGEDRSMKARVTVTLKNGVLDPQGKAIVGALGSLGFEGVGWVRQGKVFDVELDTSDKAKAEANLKAMCEKLLANTEDYISPLIDDFQGFAMAELTKILCMNCSRNWMPRYRL